MHLHDSVGELAPAAGFGMCIRHDAPREECVMPGRDTGSRCQLEMEN